MPELILTSDEGTAANTLALADDKGRLIRVHPLWLRERCTDSGSLDATTGQRLQNPSDLAPLPEIESLRQSADGTFHIRFADGASGSFGSASLAAELPHGAGLEIPAPRAWSACDSTPASFDWRTLGDDAACRRALHAFLENGYITLSHVPCEKGAVLDVGRRFGFARETNFGTLFDVRSVPGACDLAYTSLHLDPHTDNPYRHPVPGIQLLHALVNDAQGGLSTLVDGLAVAEHLRAHAPEKFDVLAKVSVRFRYRDPSTDLAAEAPILALDAAGQFAAIHYSPRLDFVPLLPFEELDLFYAARRTLDHLLRSEMFERRFRLAAGELIMFDNQRLLHGRTEFDPESGLRHLQGCYIDSDGPRSLYRVLGRGV